jgi:hypothetical protein
VIYEDGLQLTICACYSWDKLIVRKLTEFSTCVRRIAHTYRDFPFSCSVHASLRSDFSDYPSRVVS